MNTQLIGCRLPHGLIIQHPLDENLKVEIKGLNSSRIIGAEHMVTEVDKATWEAWYASHKNFPPLKNKAIFAIEGGESEGEAMAREFKSIKTGFEQMPQKAMGIKPVEKE